MIYLKINNKCISKDNEKIMNRQGKFFLSKKFKDYANDVAWQVKQQYKNKPLECDISVSAVFYMTNKVHADITNLPKGLFDALNKLVWKDDRQIKQCYLEIIYNKNMLPGIEIKITELE